jgi:prepilin-type N-terminal cleavage/methylation domain-containing protein
MKMQPYRHQRGFTLIELLLVMAIMGLILLIAIPNFAVMRQSYKLRTSTTGMSTEVRKIRQRAITQTVQTKLTWTVGADARRYASFWRPMPTTAVPNPAWNMIGMVREFEEPVFLEATGFSNISGDGDGRPDVLFLPNGTIGNMPADPDDATITINTEANIPKKPFYIRFAGTGSIQVCSNLPPAACIP